jgi:hypothetical protein
MKTLRPHLHVDQASLDKSTTHDMVVHSDAGWETKKGLTGHKLSHIPFLVAAVLSLISAVLCLLAIASPNWVVSGHAADDAERARDALAALGPDLREQPYPRGNPLYLRAFGCSGFGPMFSTYAGLGTLNSSVTQVGYQTNENGICKELALGRCRGEDMKRELGKYAYAVWKCLAVWEICKQDISWLIFGVLLVAAILNLIVLVFGFKLAFEMLQKSQRFQQYTSKKFLQRWNTYRCSILDMRVFYLRFFAMSASLSLPFVLRAWEASADIISVYSHTIFLI